MDYHEAFWVVTGTAAPVIALAAIVSLIDTLRPDPFPELDDMKRDRGIAAWNQKERFKRWTVITFIMGGLNAILMILLMMWSMFSLALRADAQDPQIAALFTTIGLGLALLSAMGTITARMARWKAVWFAVEHIQRSEATPDNKQHNGNSTGRKQNMKSRRR